MRRLWMCLKMFAMLTLITGIVYPLFITLVAQLAFAERADGDFIFTEGQARGALLIGQKFEAEEYFWPRPSATDYNALPSKGSNLAPTSLALKKVVQERQEKWAQAHATDRSKVPPEFLFASGSGLDPHISVEGAYFQIPRVAKARRLTEEQLKHMVDAQILPKSLGFFGKRRVNVLLLNQQLDLLSNNS